MHVYLPIAEVSENIFVLLGIGGGVGFLSGMYGVGGGFLLTPILIFIGVPPAVAVATGANQLIGSSVSGVLAHWKRGNVDIKMGIVLLVGGVVGSTLGVWLFTLLKSLGQIDLVIKICYVAFLGVVGGLMLVESIKAILAKRAKIRRRMHQHNWMHGLPFKMRFRRSRLYISVFLPLLVGALVGILSAIMGVSGGFIIVPAMIYFLGMPTSVVVGTSLFQIIFVTANVTILQSVSNQTVDVMLAMLLLVGGVIGAQIGARVGSKIQAEQLRGLLALIVLAVCIVMGIDLVSHPANLYSISIL